MRTLRQQVCGVWTVASDMAKTESAMHLRHHRRWPENYASAGLREVPLQPKMCLYFVLSCLS